MDNHNSNNKSVNGAIAWMTRNAVASNFIDGDFVTRWVLQCVANKARSVPGFSVDIISVTVPYPGASPEEVEQGIILAVEEELKRN